MDIQIMEEQRTLTHKENKRDVREWASDNNLLVCLDSEKEVNKNG